MQQVLGWFLTEVDDILLSTLQVFTMKLYSIINSRHMKMTFVADRALLALMEDKWHLSLESTCYHGFKSTSCVHCN